MASWLEMLPICCIRSCLPAKALQTPFRIATADWEDED